MLNNGLYEQVINKSLDKELAETDKLIQTASIDPAEAVGGAVGHNPVSIIVPCHRVVGADGSLTGYAGGIDRKKFLLELEGNITR